MLYIFYHRLRKRIHWRDFHDVRWEKQLVEKSRWNLWNERHIYINVNKCDINVNKCLVVTQTCLVWPECSDARMLPALPKAWDSSRSWRWTRLTSFLSFWGAKHPLDAHPGISRFQPFSPKHQAPTGSGPASEGPQLFPIFCTNFIEMRSLVYHPSGPSSSWLGTYDLTCQQGPSPQSKRRLFWARR